jgi:hypothetical protein
MGEVLYSHGKESGGRSEILSAEDNAVVLEAEPPPAELRAALMPVVPTIVEAAIAAIRNHGPDLGAVESALERNLRLGLSYAVDRWLEAVPAPSSDSELHFALGRAQARAGRSLDEMMGFYRIAAQTMWRRLTEVGPAEGIEPRHLYRLAETGFGWVDELSTQAAAGFADEQSHRSGASHSRRSELVRLLLEDPQPGEDMLEAAARVVGVDIGRTLAFFVGAAEHYDQFTRAARDQVLRGPREGEFVGVLFDPDGPGRRRQLAAAAERAGIQLALGPAVAIADARSSLARARALHGLTRRALVQAGALADANHHDIALLLSADPELARELARRLLAPLESIRGRTTRANLESTLWEWLGSPGQRKAIAHALGVHPQTVRYRMARLRELFGAALDDSDCRFELELALRVRPYAGLLPVAAAAARRPS